VNITIITIDLREYHYNNRSQRISHNITIDLREYHIIDLREYHTIDLREYHTIDLREYHTIDHREIELIVTEVVSISSRSGYLLISRS